MARMIPDISPQCIDNPGERRFNEAALALPDDIQNAILSIIAVSKNLSIFGIISGRARCLLYIFHHAEYQIGA